MSDEMGEETRVEKKAKRATVLNGSCKSENYGTPKK